MGGWLWSAACLSACLSACLPACLPANGALQKQTVLSWSGRVHWLSDITLPSDTDDFVASKCPPILILPVFPASSVVECSQYRQHRMRAFCVAPLNPHSP
ncbi:hypothetical protein B0H66DRAFT_375650 [Apodospora peruviana]|uniref:Secreted protein n=1 Tax=Apodospora peruviana TaxID=516989 RepID=A0AAE0M0D2_9PEZI|nr:hypothetical protein B0H66DRAFT_375650 [Apodospora peruviana]